MLPVFYLFILALNPCYICASAKMESNPVFVDIHRAGGIFSFFLFFIYFFCTGVISAMCAHVTQTYARDCLLPMGSFTALVWRGNPAMHKTRLQALRFCSLSLFIFFVLIITLARMMMKLLVALPAQPPPRPSPPSQAPPSSASSL